MEDRYIRQKTFRHIGEKGQRILLSSRIAVVGMGGLGSVIANLLCRGGIGYLRLIDRDKVELNNLQRQVLYTEKDVQQKRMKAEAAKAQLTGINSEVKVEAVLKELNAQNAESLLSDMDLVVDATDNVDTRYLINEVCVKHKIPWVYGGVVGSEGMTMNILPEGPCFACMTGKQTNEGLREGRKCTDVGILNSLTSVMGALQCTEAVKILLHSSAVRKNLLFFDIWENEAEEIAVEKREDCPVCGRREFWYLDRMSLALREI